MTDSFLSSQTILTFSVSHMMQFLQHSPLIHQASLLIYSCHLAVNISRNPTKQINLMERCAQYNKTTLENHTVSKIRHLKRD